MQTLKHQIILILLGSLLSCNVAPKAIQYGSDGCHFCKMTIVDKVHAAQMVSKKGKVYTFDATECMINNMKDTDPAKIAMYLSNNYMEPEALIDATNATFLISKEIPSPMGAFLSAFATRNEAEDMQLAKGGTLYNWQELLEHFNN